jgi:PhoPQ-activated pathogenicity-related protein
MKPRTRVPPAGGRSAPALLAAGLLASVLLALFALPPAGAASAAPAPEARRHATPLDRYVAAPDPAYAWERLRGLRGKGCVAHVLKMTSQTWLTPEEVDRTDWWHWLTIVEPEAIRSDVALLYLHGGDNEDEPPDEIRPVYARIARETGAVVAELRMVPNQPLRFSGDAGGPRKEDRLIAYGWSRFLRGGDPVWLPRLPMTKSAVRAMDTVTAFFEQRRGSGPRVDRFVLVGSSKRGWTTWTTAAVDGRVAAIVPMVIDLLNVEDSFRHHYDAYGFWAPAIRAYLEMGIPAWFGTPEMRRLREIADPFSYRARLTMPKLIINATGDQFFLPDSSRFYFEALPGEKLLRYLPNANHSLDKKEVGESVLAFFRAIVAGTPRPEYSWTFEDDGSIRVEVGGSQAPAEARLWQATNPVARDFRLETLGPAWTSAVIAPQPGGGYRAAVPQPPSGWTAFFVELTYRSDVAPPLKLTTAVRVVPDTLPFAGARR